MPKFTSSRRSTQCLCYGRSPSHAAVAATAGILDLLDEDEIRGVLAHEMSHILHRDILISTIVATFASAIGMIANIAQWAAIFGGGRDDDGDAIPSPSW